MKSPCISCGSSRPALWLALSLSCWGLLAVRQQQRPALLLVAVESFGWQPPPAVPRLASSPISPARPGGFLSPGRRRAFVGAPAGALRLSASHSASVGDDGDDDDECYLAPVPAGMEGVPIPFVESPSELASSKSLGFIECYADSLATCLGEEYTIGVPCDYAVALCTYSSERAGGGGDDDESDDDEDDDDVEGELVPLELDDPELDDVFPVAEAIVADGAFAAAHHQVPDPTPPRRSSQPVSVPASSPLFLSCAEFGEELVLQRTPQTLTLVGELEEDDEEEFEEGEDDDSEEDEDEDEEVEVLLKFEHRDKEYQLVRFLDPILLVGKRDPENPERRLLLGADESDRVMPLLEGLFLDYRLQDNPDAILP
jgi:hypothetical protein